MKEKMVIFVRTYDLLTWSSRSARNSRAQRFVVTKRLQDAALDLQERLFEANAARTRGRRVERLEQSDVALQKLRLYLRLAHRWRWLNDGQYEHVSRMLADVGKLLGGWLRVTRPERG